MAMSNYDDEVENMSPEKLKNLAAGYRGISAPPGFATRVRMAAEEKRAENRWWQNFFQPRYAVGVVCTIILLAVVMDNDSKVRPGSAPTSEISLSALSSGPSGIRMPMMPSNHTLSRVGLSSLPSSPGFKSIGQLMRSTSVRSLSTKPRREVNQTSFNNTNEIDNWPGKQFAFRSRRTVLT
jgi:hypothetical protein